MSRFLKFSQIVGKSWWCFCSSPFLPCYFSKMMITIPLRNLDKFRTLKRLCHHRLPFYTHSSTQLFRLTHRHVLWSQGEGVSRWYWWHWHFYISLSLSPRFEEPFSMLFTMDVFAVLIRILIETFRKFGNASNGEISRYGSITKFAYNMR